jgi:hypothetical protein
MEYLKYFYCNKNQSIILKKLGFNYRCNSYFLFDGSIKFGPANINYNINKNNTSVPIIYETSRFIREKYGLHINIDCNASGWFWQLVRIETGSVLENFKLLNTDSGYIEDYYECYRDGISIALNYILTNNQ